MSARKRPRLSPISGSFPNSHCLTGPRVRGPVWQFGGGGPMAPNLFRLLLLAIVVYALMRGGRDEKAAALMCLVAAVATTDGGSEAVKT